MHFNEWNGPRYFDRDFNAREVLPRKPRARGRVNILRSREGVEVRASASGFLTIPDFVINKALPCETSLRSDVLRLILYYLSPLDFIRSSFMVYTE